MAESFHPLVVDDLYLYNAGQLAHPAVLDVPTGPQPWAIARLLLTMLPVCTFGTVLHSAPFGRLWCLTIHRFICVAPS